MLLCTRDGTDICPVASFLRGVGKGRGEGRGKGGGGEGKGRGGVIC